MDKRIGIGAGTALGVMIAAAAHAQPPANMQMACSSMLTVCTYDSHDTLVGIPWPLGYMIRQISGAWYAYAGVRDDGMHDHECSPDVNCVGISELVQYYYESGDCTGQALMPVNAFLPTLAAYDGHATWAPVGKIATFTWSSILTAVAPGQTSPHCYRRTAYDGDGQFTGAPAKRVEARTFSRPFKMQ